MKIRWIGRQAALLVFGLVLGAFVFKGDNFLERLLIDLRFFMVSSLHVQEHESDTIAIIRIDTRSEKELALPYGPKWRQFYPALIRKLNDAGASLIVFDAMFLDKENQWDTPLAAAIAKAGNVVAGEDGSRPTQEALRGTFLAVGNLSAALVMGEPRRARFGAADGPAQKPLAVVAVEAYLKRTSRPAAESAAEAGIRSVRPPGFWINYNDPAEYFPSFSFADVLEGSDGRIGDPDRTPASVFADRIVFIGLDDPTSGNDRFVFPNTLGRELPGVYGHAFAADTILRNRAVTRASPLVDAGITILFIAVLLLVLDIRARMLRSVLLAILPIAVFLMCLTLLSGLNLWIGYAPLLVAFWAVLIPHWVLLRLTLSARLSMAVGFDSRLIDAFRRESSRSGGQVRKEVSILIADVRDYTRYVSRTEPSTVSQVMSEYMDAMERCITGQGGYINKYVGDEVIAVFGFPLAAEKSAQRAVRAAITMLDELARLVASWKGRDLPSIERIGIGIDTGTVVFAEIGGRTRSQFDIIGDCINGASRIEHLTKDLERSLLISEESCRGLENDDSTAGSFELVRKVAVRGQGERKVFGLVR